MGLPVTLRIALRALAKNKMRASLTVLGVVIGIAAVTTMVSVGQSASRLVQDQFESFGTNVIVIFPGSQRGNGVNRGRSSPTLTAKDSDAIERECQAVLAASPMVFAGGQLIHGNLNWSPKEMVGVGPTYLSVRNWPIRRGSFFTSSDVNNAAKVCVIGQTVVDKLFQTRDPLGKSIRINNIPFRIIGILQKKGANLVGEDQDDLVLAPFTTIRKRMRGSLFNNVDIIMASARSANLSREAEYQITSLLFERHQILPGDDPDFEVQDTREIAQTLGVITGTLTTMLSAIAGISLLVGGVGIMNIMLVSVTERTREIGIRMAVGARGRDILLQFLVEAVLLSVLGGIVGLTLGTLASIGITTAINEWTSGTKWPVVISIPAAIVAILFASAVGVFFGFYPARRASRLDPIEALRYE